MRKLTSVLAVFILVFGTTSLLDAQATRGGAGLMLGVGATWSPSFELTSDDPDFEDGADLDAGFGFAARAGFAFTPAFAIFGAYEQSWHGVNGTDEDATLRHIFGGVRLNLPVAPSLAPYVSGGFGQRRLSADVFDEDFGQASIRLTGTFFDVGGGVQVFLNRSLTFDAGVNYGFGSFDEASVAGVTFDIGDVDANVFRIRVGLTWLPMTDR